MTAFARPVLFALFVLSGFCGLLYQVVWLRLAFAAFGIVTPVLSVVISVFMVGLALGSWGGGALSRSIGIRKPSPLWLYGAVEALIGVGAFVLPWQFGAGEKWLLTFGDMDSGRYLATSALLIAGSILPWCVCMGATFPAAMAYLKRQFPKDSSGFSYLYLANVIGAMTGALVTAIVLVEKLGFTRTLWVAAAMNAVIAVVSFALAAQDRSKPLPKPTAALDRVSTSDRSALIILFLTGFASMGMEVVWTRAFTPALRTTIYAFALLLSTYLLATWIGSYRYRKHLKRGKVASRQTLLVWLAFTACLPIALNDPRLYLRGVGALLSIFPFCALLGYLTPMLIDEHSSGDPRRAGIGYAVNIVGCVLGPLVAGYLLLPYVGVKLALVLLAVPFFAWCFGAPKKVRWITASSCVLFAASILFARSYEEQAIASNAEVRRDHTATVIAADNGAKQMYVNGISITILTPITKVMAHVPLAALDHKPESALVICFGMGTTFRSLASWGIQTWAAELVPSVRDSFGYYFADGPDLLQKPTSHVVIDDGRRFLRRTKEQFDVITLDPPPPIEAAGSSLLYSTGFYVDAKARLKPNGILQQWFPGGDHRILEAVTTSLARSFTHIRVFKSIEGFGHHFLASDSPLDGLDAAKMASRLPPEAKNDLTEWYPGQTPEQVMKTFLGQEVPLDSVRGEPDWYITDDRPLNEYYLLRRFSAR